MPPTCADIDKARALLGYHPRVRISEGIPKFVDWYLKQQKRDDGCRPAARVDPHLPASTPMATQGQHTLAKKSARISLPISLRPAERKHGSKTFCPTDRTFSGAFHPRGKRSHGSCSHRIPTRSVLRG